MGYRFNPPPTWPLPPGWEPPPTWRPDPRWPAPPAGWQVWISDTPEVEEPDEPRPAVAGVLGSPAVFRWREWFGGLPVWGRALAVLALVLLLPLVLIGGGLALAGAGVASLVSRSRPRLGLIRRRAAAVAVLAGLAAVAAGTGLTVAVTPDRARPAAAPPAVAHKPAGPPPASAKVADTRLCGAAANPYGYNHCGRGDRVFYPPADICSYLDCVADFWAGHGYLVECGDKHYSLSGGTDEPCARHGGDRRVVNER